MRENITEKILNYLNKNEPLSIKELSKKIKISYPTLLKYCDILYAEKKINITTYGKMKIVSRGTKNED